MKGLDAFLSTFGDVTVAQIVTLLLAGIFLYAVYKKVSDYIIARHEAEEAKDAQIKEALEGVRKYPEYRQQSIKIQELLENEIQELRIAQQESAARLMKMEEENKRRERNKLRDRLLQNYRYYTNKETNPTQSWTQMEAEAFWEMFSDYEQAGGNGYMHSEVLPAMERLLVVETGVHK